MKFRMTFLLAFFVIGISLLINEATVAKRKAFKPPLTEEHMLAWLKEHGYEVEKLDTDFYSISWKEELPDGQLEAVYYDSSGCKVLIESVNGKNTAYFTFSFRLNVDIDVVISSEVERIKQLGPFLEKHRYHYHIKNLATSGRPVHTFQVDCPRRWGYYEDGIIHRVHPLYPYKGGIPNLTEIVDPSGLWRNWDRPSLTVKGLKSVVWTEEGVGIIAGESQYGFAFDSIDLYQLTSEEVKTSEDSIAVTVVNSEVKGLYLSLPGIITARIDIDRSSRLIKPTVQVDGQDTNPESLPGYESVDLLNALRGSTVQIDGESVDLSGERTVEELLFQIRPQGKVIGPEAISKEADFSKLTQRLKTLTSQSAAEGWLDGSAARQLNQHLDDSQTALQNGSKRAAKQEIESFMSALYLMGKEKKSSDPSQEPPLTQEAATLLKTNVMYLLTKF